MGWTDTIEWYLSLGKGERAYKLKAVIPTFIHFMAEGRLFRCHGRPPILYEGYERARLMHFAFELEAQDGTLRSFSAQDDQDLVALPLLHAEGGQLRAAPVQHPGFDATRWENELSFLPEDVRASVLESVPAMTELAAAPSASICPAVGIATVGELAAALASAGLTEE